MYAVSGMFRGAVNKLSLRKKLTILAAVGVFLPVLVLSYMQYQSLTALQNTSTHDDAPAARVYDCVPEAISVAPEAFAIPPAHSSADRRAVKGDVVGLYTKAPAPATLFCVGLNVSPILLADALNRVTTTCD